MSPRLRSLERELVRERAELILTLLAYRFSLRWDLALTQNRSVPDPIEFMWLMIKAGLYLPTAHTAVRYLEECRRESSIPDRSRLVAILPLTP